MPRGATIPNATPIAQPVRAPRAKLFAHSPHGYVQFSLSCSFFAKSHDNTEPHLPIPLPLYASHHSSLPQFHATIRRHAP